MNRGDTIKIILNYTIDGSPIEENSFDEIEFSIGNKRYTLSGGDILWDDSLSAYTVFLSQQDTFKLQDKSMYQLRLKFGDEVVSSPRSTLILGQSISKEVL